MTTTPVDGTIALTEEGKGWVATCKLCTWLRWAETKTEARDNGREHKCLQVNLKPPGQRYPRKRRKGER